MKIHLSPAVWFDESLAETSNPHIRLAWREEHRTEGLQACLRLSHNSGLHGSAWEIMDL